VSDFVGLIRLFTYDIRPLAERGKDVKKLVRIAGVAFLHVTVTPAQAGVSCGEARAS
jgi:hypothetical protein